jgi:hypothetical protein
MRMAWLDPTVRKREGSQTQEELVMRKHIEESPEAVSDMVRRTAVDVEDERGANARCTGTTAPSTGGARRRTERGARHRPSRPRCGWAGERPS